MYVNLTTIIALQQLHDSSKDFLSRLVAYLDGEKDPRNLMIVFSVLNVPMVEWDISDHAQVRDRMSSENPIESNQQLSPGVV